MLNLLELYLEGQALTVFLGLKASLQDGGYAELEHVMKRLTQRYERDRLDRITEARAKLLSRRLNGVDDFEDYIGELLASHKTLAELGEPIN